MTDDKNCDVHAYVDGACRGNPGIGGWGVRIIVDDDEKQGLNFYGGEKYTTNNKMELTAAIEALKKCPNPPARIHMYTDSQYTKNGITDWIKNWKKNGWRTAKGEPVKNAELWKELDLLVSAKNVSWTWVKGHSSNKGNAFADALANKGIESILLERKKYA